MAYQRKTEDEYQLVYDYGAGEGPEVLCTELTLKDAKRNKQLYIENEGIWPAIVKKRIPKEAR